MEYERGKATNGSVFASLVAMGVPVLEAFKGTADAGRYIKRDDDNRPYLTAKDGAVWFVDIPGEKRGTDHGR